MFWPEMNISPYVSCVFWKTMLGIARGDQNFPIHLKFNEESNEHIFSFSQASASVVPVSFPVPEATYATFFYIFEISVKS